ncbi:LysR family transcriptional regulator [Aminobacter aganoensis]|uniref:DNA-binding transcriptional LysR family regulator n=1 Tax=Aminobacter aganoensis TaxID=83264 RepID=A0A7X0F7R8_9HYPH|nr:MULTISPECIES: LysR family transcriptional regulator [Aminobacter]KQU75841.1 hypothetical protein ASC75_17630 [Aminobacter sp. DSM 101952]MBB6354696.1 DNA-binding transcriptional LysR family regulator [Aminobacter aganoensis]
MPLITQGAKALEMVARFGSIRKAAEQMNATPSAVNRQILNLELEYGQPLFERLPRGMRPTEAGRILVGQVRKLQQEVTATDAEMEGLRPSCGSTVSIGIMECLSTGFLPKAFRMLQAQHPGASLRAYVDGTNIILDKVKSGSIDLAIAFNTPQDIGLNIVKTAHLSLGIVAHPSHRLMQRKSVDIEDILSENFLSTDDSLTIGPMADLLIQRLRSPIHKIAVSNSIALLKAIVQEGLGISILTLIDVYEEVRDGKLGFVPLSGHRMSVALSLCSRDVNALTDTGKAIAAIIASSLDEVQALSLNSA